MTRGRAAARSAAKGEADESEYESGGGGGEEKNHIIIYLFKFTVAKRHN